LETTSPNTSLSIYGLPYKSCVKKKIKQKNKKMKARQRTLHCALCRRDAMHCNCNNNSKKHDLSTAYSPRIGPWVPKTQANTNIPKAMKVDKISATPISPILNENIKKDNNILKKPLEPAWGISQKQTSNEPMFYDIDSMLTKLSREEAPIIHEETGKPQIEVLNFLNTIYKILGKSYQVTVKGYDIYGIQVDLVVKISDKIQYWFKSLRIFWFDFPWEVVSWTLDERIQLSQTRLPIGSTFIVRVIEITGSNIRLSPSKYAAPILRLSEFFPLAKIKCPYRYLIVVDLEATCDYGPNPKVTTQTAEIIEFPWILIDTQTMKIIDEQQIYVRPDNMEGITSYTTKLTGISKDTVKSRCNLQSAIRQFDEYIRRKFGNKKEFCLLTDGIWDLQVQLHKEAQKKKINLAWYYKEYLDLKEEFRLFFPWFPETFHPELKTMLKAFNLEFIGQPHNGLDDSRNIAQVILKLLLLGHSLNRPKTIPTNYDPYSDPKFIDFGSVAEPDACQCPNLLTCGVWNRPWSDKCKFCSSLHTKKNLI
jgi:inhibitor of KinA sporulation pathway (predicted exonuclease)